MFNYSCSVQAPSFNVEQKSFALHVRTHFHFNKFGNLADEIGKASIFFELEKTKNVASFTCSVLQVSALRFEISCELQKANVCLIIIFSINPHGFL